MSEYQYYEFLAVDRSLTAAEMAKLRAISSRAEITPTSFKNHYEWGDLKADPAELLSRYFDLHVYVTNWGTRCLMIRLPRDLFSAEVLAPYFVDDQWSSARYKGDHLILRIVSETQDAEDWVDEEQWMGALVDVRKALLGGDRRFLCLAWLSWLTHEMRELAEEDVPPIPEGLGSLSESLLAMVEFLRIEHPLIDAVAKPAS